jgi:hypothetical protein
MKDIADWELGRGGFIAYISTLNGKPVFKFGVTVEARPEGISVIMVEQNTQKRWVLRNGGRAVRLTNAAAILEIDVSNMPPGVFELLRQHSPIQGTWREHVLHEYEQAGIDPGQLLMQTDDEMPLEYRPVPPARSIKVDIGVKRIILRDTATGKETTVFKEDLEK